METSTFVSNQLSTMMTVSASKRRGPEAGEGVWQLISFTPSQTIPELPVEIYGIIAEHLIGDFSCRTLASLNQTSRSIHLETSPMLFETVHFTDNYLFRGFKNPPENWKYIKYASPP
jgi:hypothetical protein